MASLLYICPDNHLSAGSPCIELASAMLSCSHQVRVLSSFSQDNEDFKPPRRIQFLMPFKHWSLVEMPKLLLATQGYYPDVVHFFYDHSKPECRKLLNVSIPGLFKSMFGSKIVLQVIGNAPKKSLAFNMWLNQSDLVITSDHQQLLKVSSMPESPKHQAHLSLRSPESLQIETPQFSWIKEYFEEYIYVAGSVDTVEQATDIVKTTEYLLKDSPSLGLVMNVEGLTGGVRAEGEFKAFLQDNFLDSRVILLHGVNLQQDFELTSHCSSYFIAHLGVEPSNLSLTLDSFLGPEQNVYCSAQQAYFVRSSAYKKIKITECALNKPILEDTLQEYIAPGRAKPNDTLAEDPMNALNRSYHELLSR